MADRTATYVFQCETQVFYSEINANFRNLFSAVNGNLDSANLSACFSWPASGVTYTTSATLYTSIQAEGALDEICVDFDRLTGVTYSQSTLSAALHHFNTSINSITDKSASNIYFYVPTLPGLIYETCTTMRLGHNAYADDTAQILFPNGILRTVTEVTSSFKHRTIAITQTFSLSSTAAAQTGLSTAWTGIGQANNGWLSVYAAGICGSTEFTLAGKKDAPPYPSNIDTLDLDFGIQNWVYLGTVKTGYGRITGELDGAGASAGILSFRQVGNEFIFQEKNVIHNFSANGVAIAESFLGTAISSVFSAADVGDAELIQFMGRVQVLALRSVSASLGLAVFINSSNHGFAFGDATVSNVGRLFNAGAADFSRIEVRSLGVGNGGMAVHLIGYTDKFLE